MFVSGCTGSIGADEDSAQNGQIEKGSSEAMPYPYDHRMPPQSEGTPHLERACLRQRAGVIRLVHPLPISGSFLLSGLSLGLRNAICNRTSVVDTISS
jgi:hypothetical protein